MSSEYAEPTPGNTEVVQENTNVVNSWSAWASEHPQLLWGVAAGGLALVLGWTARSLSRNRVSV